MTCKCYKCLFDCHVPFTIIISINILELVYIIKFPLINPHLLPYTSKQKQSVRLREKYCKCQYQCQDDAVHLYS